MERAQNLRGYEDGLPAVNADRGGVIAAVPPRTPALPTTHRHQRVNGHASISFSKAGVSDLYQRAPCRLLFPHNATEEDAPLAVFITTSGGLTGGDCIGLDITILPGGRATVTTQAAEKLYRVLPDEEDISIATTINIEAGGVLEWLSQEAIVFNNSRLRRSLDISMSDSARLLSVEIMMLGRDAMGEEFSSGSIHDSWRIRRNGRLIWADALHYVKDGTVSSSPLSEGEGVFEMGDARALATLVYAGPDAGDYLDLARELAPAPSGGATIINGLLIIRLMDRDGMALRAAASRILSALRVAALGASSTLPALWTC